MQSLSTHLKALPRLFRTIAGTNVGITRVQGLDLEMVKGLSRVRRGALRVQRLWASPVGCQNEHLEKTETYVFITKGVYIYI